MLGKGFFYKLSSVSLANKGHKTKVFCSNFFLAIRLNHQTMNKCLSNFSYLRHPLRIACPPEINQWHFICQTCEIKRRSWCPIGCYKTTIPTLVPRTQLPTLNLKCMKWTKKIYRSHNNLDCSVSHSRSGWEWVSVRGGLRAMCSASALLQMIKHSALLPSSLHSIHLPLHNHHYTCSIDGLSLTYIWLPK